MPLSTYSELKTSIANWLNREDLTSQIPDFISLAEARFNRELRVPDMIKRSQSTITTGYVDLPTDWLQSVAIRVSSSDRFNAIEYITSERYYDLVNKKLTDLPRYYTILNRAIHLMPEPTDSITLELTYYAKLAALSESNTSNWLLARSPDLYLHASLIQAEAYLQNDERIPLWAASVEKTIADIKLEGEKAYRPSGALIAQKRSFG
jgi:hypothetical protein